MASRPSRRRRLLAVASILLDIVAVALVVSGLAGEVWRLLVSVPLLGLALVAAWIAVTRTGWRRALAVIVGTCFVIAVVFLAVLGHGTSAGRTVAGVAAFLLAGVFAREALGLDPRTLRERPTSGRRVPAAARPVLLINPRSGDGKAERTGLVQACVDRGIEPVVLSPGDDLAALTEGALDRGADVIGMAGGDGSQAIVASAASARNVPMVVVPSGTRNHFALDLGLDPDDVIDALDAYGEAAERSIDLGEMNGRTFVNNASLGLYATIVRSPEYRDAKVETALSTVPSVLGPGTEPFDLTYAGPDGTKHNGAHVIQVSNNPYRRSLTAAGRPRLDTHRLGVITLVIEDERRFLAYLARGRPDRYEGLESWTTESFEVASSSSVDVGLDGESLSVDPPLSFSIRPSALRVRLPLHSYGLSPAERTPSASAAFRGVWRVAKGEDVSV